MSVPEQIPYVGYIANGTSTEFPITFDLHDPDYLVVTVNKEIPEKGTYSIDMNTLKVLFGVAPNEGDQVELYRETMLNRDTNYQKYDNSFRPEAVNWDFDKIMHILQEQHMIDAELASRLKQEIEWRRTHDANFDELAKMRDAQVFAGLKGYVDTLYSASNPNIFDGVTAGIVFALDKKSVQTHLENIYDQLAAGNVSIKEERDRAESAERLLKEEQEFLDQKITDEHDRAVAAEQVLDAKINANGVGNRAYKTYAEMDADKANIPVKSKVTVTNDSLSTNNGDWNWDGSVFTKSIFDPINQSKNYTDTSISKFIEKTVGKNLYNSAMKVVGELVSNTGNITSSSGWSRSEFIEVVAGQQYTVSSSASSRRVGLALYKEKNAASYIANSYNEVGGNVTITAPSTAKYLVINVDSPTTTGVNVQVELGGVATSYEPYSSKSSLKDDYLPDSAVTYPGLEQAIKKDYEVKKLYKNLFNKNTGVVDGFYLNNVGKIGAAVGWGMSAKIKVEPNKFYTLSGSRSRGGLSGFANENDVDAVFYNASNTMPLTVQIPANVNYVAFNLYTATAPNWNLIQFEEGQVATPYEPESGTKILINPTYIDGASNVVARRVDISGTVATVSAMVDNVPISHALRLTRENTHSQSIVFDYISDIVDSVVQRNLGDEAAPLHADNTTIGANHGYNKADLTLANHGKTVADIGSVWSSGVRQYVIVDIVSSNVLSITSRYDNEKYELGELTHVSGAANTSSFTPTAMSNALQWHPVIKDRTLVCAIDGTHIDLSKNGSYEFKDSVKFTEYYEIMRKTDLVEWLILHKGQNHVNYDAVPSIAMSHAYTFDHECGQTIAFNCVGLKPGTPFVDASITQSIKLGIGNGAVYYFVPKSTPMNIGSTEYNFTQPEPIESKRPSANIIFNKGNNEPNATPVDRLIQLNDQVFYATGYLPLYDADPAIRTDGAVEQYLEIRSDSLKVYPRLKHILSQGVLNAGDNISGVAYRRYGLRENGRIKFPVRDASGDFFFIHWLEVGKLDRVPLPADYVGRDFEIVEKSENINLLSTFASTTMLVQVGADKNYGYLTLRFK
jgi:hypothetical protein